MVDTKKEDKDKHNKTFNNGGGVLVDKPNKSSAKNANLDKEKAKRIL